MTSTLYIINITQRWYVLLVRTNEKGNSVLKLMGLFNTKTTRIIRVGLVTPGRSSWRYLTAYAKFAIRAE